MGKVVLTSNVINSDTIATVNEPVTIKAVTTTGIEVLVPANTVAGATVLLNDDGTAPSDVLQEGVNLFSAEEAAKQLLVVG